MLKAYFDESYNQRTSRNPNGPRFFTVGCWLSTAGHWKRFEKKWGEALSKAGISAFHMNKYENRKQEYSGWKQDKRVSVLKSLHRAIRAHTIYGCSITLNCEDFDSLTSQNPKLKSYFGKSYYGFDVMACIMAMNEWCDDKGISGPIDYMFADLPKQGSSLDPMFRLLLKDPKLRSEYRLAGTWTKALARDVPALQAADIIAYESNKRALNHMTEGVRFIRQSLENLRLEYNFDPLYFGEIELRRWGKDFFSADST